MHLLDLYPCLDINRPPKLPRMIHWKEILLELYCLTQRTTVSGNDPKNEADTAAVQSETPSALARPLPLPTRGKVNWFGGMGPACVMRLWFARNMERFWDSWMDWGSAIFRRNWAALEGRNTASPRPPLTECMPSPPTFLTSPHLQLQGCSLRAPLQYSLALSSFYQLRNKTQSSDVC